MIVRCGHCQSGFDVPGPGQHSCPACGTLNEVRAAEPPAPGPEVAPAPPPHTAPPEAPAPRVTCGDCGFNFIVGAVDEAPCPNCGVLVAITGGSGGES